MRQIWCARFMYGQNISQTTGGTRCQWEEVVIGRSVGSFINDSLEFVPRVRAVSQFQEEIAHRTT